MKKIKGYKEPSAVLVRKAYEAVLDQIELSNMEDIGLEHRVNGYTYEGRLADVLVLNNAAVAFAVDLATQPHNQIEAGLYIAFASLGETGVKWITYLPYEEGYEKDIAIQLSRLFYGVLGKSPYEIDKLVYPAYGRLVPENPMQPILEVHKGS